MPADRVASVTIVEGSAQFVFDDRGKRYLDGIAGLWYSHIGHGRTEMADAIRNQAVRLGAYQTHGDFDNLPALALADRLAGLFPIEDPLVFFGSGGGDGVETACKLARDYWQAQGTETKAVIISRQNSYHGMHGFGSSVAGIPALHVGSEDGFPRCVVAANDASALEEAIHRLGPSKVAGFIAEPVIGAGGVIPPSDGYLEAVQAICRNNDVLLICDEVITGFGRLGSWSGAEHFGLQPDMAVIAKGLTSGYVPLGGVIASRRIWQSYEGTGRVFRHGYTYAGHPTACAAGLANLDILDRENLIDGAAALAVEFADVLGTLEELDAVAEIRRVGLMAGVGFDQEYIASRVGQLDGFDFGGAVTTRCREAGLILRRMFQGDLQISPPLVIDVDDITFSRDVVAASIEAVLRHPVDD